MIKMKLKMYILIMDWVDLGHAINSASHASLMGYLKWKDEPIMNEWLSDSFRKVTCKINEDEFERAKQFDDFEIVTELAFDKREVGLVFKPRYQWPKFFNYLKLYK
jgi:peptidyl-tRNA hydrolase